MTIVLEHDKREWKNIFGNSVEKVETMPSPRFIKTHLTWDLLPAEIETVKPKVLLIIIIAIFISYTFRTNQFYDNVHETQLLITPV